jgi:hypothetical protein
MHWVVSGPRVAAFGIAAAALAVVLLVVVAGAGRGVLAKLVCGSDGRTSTSKTQAVVWTGIALFGLLEVFVERVMLGISDFGSVVPVNMLIAMGFSVTTMTAAKGITVSYIASGLVDKRGNATLGGLVTDDDGEPELSKIQMLAFTLVAVAIYLVRMALQETTPPEITDIEPALMVLMGLSQGAYLGKKLVTTESPRVAGMAPARGKPGDRVTLTGTNLGSATAGTVVTVGGTAALLDPTAATDTIAFFIPPQHGGGVAWTTHERAGVVVVANGREATAPVDFIVEGT